MLHDLHHAAAAQPSGGFSASAADYVRSRPKPLTTSLRALVEARIERLIEILDRLDGDPDLEPSTGSPEVRGTPCIDVGRWMALQLDRLDGPASWLPDGHRVSALSQAHWAEAAAFDEREEDDPGEESDPLEKNGDEEDCNLGSEDEMSGWDMHRAGVYYNAKAEAAAQQHTTVACSEMIERLQAIQRKVGQGPVSALRTLGGAILKG